LDKGLVKQAIFMGFNIELLRTTQNLLLHKAAVDFPFCLPTQRIEFDHPDKKRSESPRNASTIIYIPGTQDNTAGFIREFQQVGAICRSITN
ncbi:MAG: hypothetical protein ACRDEA_03835, partial [Microcystaceae cyanobacterium]